jgi:toxin-antitoxin system PIN domain toxin
LVLPDVNVLVNAHRQDAPRHHEYLSWLKQVLSSDAAFGVSDLVLSGFLRVVTHPRVFRDPTPLGLALEFVVVIRDHPNAVTVSPGERHWDIFQRLCQEVNAKGNLIPDAYLAALAIETGAEWITTDRDYARFSGLRWRHPLT